MSFVSQKQGVEPFGIDSIVHVAHEITLEELSCIVHLCCKLVPVEIPCNVEDFLYFGRFFGREYRLEFHLIGRRHLQHHICKAVEFVKILHIAEMIALYLRYGGFKAKVYAILNFSYAEPFRCGIRILTVNG